MKIKQGFSIKTENGQNVVICDKNINKEFNSTIILSDTYVYMWNFLQNGNPTKEELLNGLLDNFNISTVLALNDIDVFIRTLKENGIIEEWIKNNQLTSGYF